MTLGISLGDVVAWLFVFGFCIDWLINLDVNLGGYMMKIWKVTFDTGMATLAALRGHGNDWVPRQATC